MKKILFILALFAIGFIVSAQSIDASGYETQAAVSIKEATSYNYKVNDISAPYFIGYQCQVDSTLGTAAGLGAIFTLHGSYDGVDYSPALYTMTYAGIEGTSHDTVVVVSNTTNCYYRYLRATWTVTDTIQVAHTIKLQKIVR